MFNMFPVSDPNRATEFLADIHTGIEAIVLHAGEDESVSSVMSHIVNGNLLLWVAFVDGKYCGFVTTVIIQRGAQRLLKVDHLYIEPGFDIDILKEGEIVLNQHAEANSCTHIVFYTTRASFERRLKDLGYKPTYTEYAKEVERV